MTLIFLDLLLMKNVHDGNCKVWYYGYTDDDCDCGGKEIIDSFDALIRVARAAEKVEPYGPEDAVKEFCDALSALPEGLLDE